MGKSREFKHETRQDVQEIAQYLRDLASGFENGSLTLNSDIDQITIKPEGIVKLEVKTKVGEDKGKMELELKWNENKDTQLHISSGTE